MLARCRVLIIVNETHPIADSQRSAVSSSGTTAGGQSVSDIMFCGLAVRMVIASGHVERCQTHAISNRAEYQGEIRIILSTYSCTSLKDNLVIAYASQS